MKKVRTLRLVVILVSMAILLSIPLEGSAKWWDKFGEPKYGGTMLYRVRDLNLDLDPYGNWGGQYDFFGDRLWSWDWTLERDKWAYQTLFTPDAYWKGNVVESWEIPDPQTVIAHIRHGVKWHDKEPMNGREFTAHDVEYHYDRIMGTGSGFTKPCPLYAGRIRLWKKVTAIDDYTVEFKFSYPSAQIFLSIAEQAGQNCITPREWVELGDKGKNDWKTAVGTGPWILAEFTEGASAVYKKNPNYWGVDERYPKNRLPYANELRVLCIPDIATSLAAIRSGQIDLMAELSWQQAKSLAASNPRIQQQALPAPGQGPQYRVDKKPFTDIRVRKALEMAIDRKTIAATYFGGSVDGKPCGVVNPAHKGYDYPYDSWPQELKDEYSYNPERAKKLLAEAGYPDGFKTNVVMANISDTELAEIIKAYFQEIGVDMEIRTMDMGSLMGFSRAKKHDQMYWSGICCGRTFVPQMAISSTSTDDFANYGCVSDPAYDEMYKKFMTTTDPAEARKIVNDAVRYALEKHWVLNICPTKTYNVYQPQLKGYSGEIFAQASPGWIWARLWKEK